VHAGQMTAGNMADFVREDADDFAGRIRLHQKAGMDENSLATGDECVEIVVVDDMYAHGSRIEACGFEEWRHIDPDGIFDLSIANKP